MRTIVFRGHDGSFDTANPYEVLECTQSSDGSHMFMSAGGETHHMCGYCGYKIKKKDARKIVLQNTTWISIFIVLVGSIFLAYIFADKIIAAGVGYYILTHAIIIVSMLSIGLMQWIAYRRGLKSRGII